MKYIKEVKPVHTSELNIAPRSEQALLIALSFLLRSATSTNISRYFILSSTFPWLQIATKTTFEMSDPSHQNLESNDVISYHL